MNLFPISPLRGLAVAALSAGLAFSALADTPNLRPGLWENTSTIKIEAEFPFPEQTNTSTDCLTQEEIDRGDSFMEMEDMEECEFTERDLRRDGARFAMSCRGEEGMDFQMVGEFEFNGETSTGTMTGNAQTPMGPMKTIITMEGRRIGDC